MNNLYEILAVERTASAEEIKKSYRKLSKKYHPDVNQGDKNAEIKFKEISQAYAVLSNAQLRKEYDEKLVGNKKPKEAQDEPPQQRKHSSTKEFDIGNMNMNFEHFFGFDPKSKENTNLAGKNQAGNKNPLDTSHIFEGFFKPKKK